MTYTYDNANRPLTMVDGTGTTSYGHDAYGRVNSVTNGAGAVVGYGYDTLGRIGTIVYPGSHTVTRGYDADSRLHTVTDWNSNQTVFGYDADSNLHTTTYPNGVVTTNTIGTDDDISSIAITNSGTTLASFGYTYTPSNLVATRTDSLDPTTSLTYGYNTLHQLVGLNTATTAYAYDSAGNLTTLPNGSTISYDDAGQAGTLTPTSGPSTTFGFDGVGERTSATTSGSATIGYTYNQAGELTGSTNTPGGTASYSYDGNGLRASTTDTGGAHASTWDTITASLPLLLSDGTNEYLYGPNDKVIEQLNISAGTTTYLQQDREGSTRLITNTSGTVVGSKSYDAYGNVTATTGTASSPFGYTGEYTDLSGLLYLRARYYDPTTGQFLTVDGLVGVTRAAYAYAASNPVNDVDPTGEGARADDGGTGYADTDVAYPVESDTCRNGLIASTTGCVGISQRKSTNSAPVPTKVGFSTTAERVQYALQFLMSKGLTLDEAAGFEGNLQYESGGYLDPTQWEEGEFPPCPHVGGEACGRGIGQWTDPGSRWSELAALAQREGVAPTTFAVQMQFVWQELTTTKAWVLTGLKEEDDEDSVSGATSYIEDKYEVPEDPPSSFGGRLHYAETALAAYDG